MSPAEKVVFLKCDQHAREVYSKYDDITNNKGYSIEQRVEMARGLRESLCEKCQSSEWHAFMDSIKCFLDGIVDSYQPTKEAAA